jgi:hypothetical protein
MGKLFQGAISDGTISHVSFGDAFSEFFSYDETSFRQNVGMELAENIWF